MNNQVVHLGIIMDGNRRWAKSKGLLAFEGHRRGSEKIREVVRWCAARGIKFLTLYAFSTENWKRSKKEISFLINLIDKYLQSNIEEFHKEKGRLRIMGDRSKFSSRLVENMQRAEAETRNNKKITVNILLNYGGRAEITAAVKKLIREGAKAKKVTEEMIAGSLYTAGMPDPDLIIRTSGEQRLSGFLTWQSVYSELYFCGNHWPDFAEKDLDRALSEYSLRHRKKGR